MGANGPQDISSDRKSHGGGSVIITGPTTYISLGAPRPRCLPMPLHNAAGWIQNILEEPCGGVAVIRSLAGSERSNHYHRTDWHWLYVLEGEMHYYERKVGDTKPAARRIIRQDERIFTGPLIEHVCRFPVDTTVISMSKLSRTHDAHEADVVRVHVETE